MKVNTGIDEKDRKEVVDGLSHLLADTYTLYLKTHGFHWNVTGPMFKTRHELFMTQYTELWEALDLIAERIRALGSLAPASSSEFTALSSIPETKGAPEAKEMIKLLLEGHEAVSRRTRELVPTAEKAEDASTVDLLTERLNIHEKTAWMLRSLLE